MAVAAEGGAGLHVAFEGAVEDDRAVFAAGGAAVQGAQPGQPGTIYIRPEALMPGGAENTLTAGIERVDFEGSFALVHGRFDGGEALAASIPSTRLAEAPEPGSRASFGFAPGHAVVLGDG